MTNILILSIMFCFCRKMIIYGFHGELFVFSHNT